MKPIFYRADTEYQVLGSKNEWIRVGETDLGRIVSQNELVIEYERMEVNDFVRRIDNEGLVELLIHELDVEAERAGSVDVDWVNEGF
ncbi:hypothetical protein [Lignipirellula cremea]|uniref:Uncharacterized protein n=1 Tax=Lignipirellula cremea TaxID=2528010 RepID=A0A518DQK4_9BACT|nr:hypothetical protein [Lignipirellula cremea]QDU94125.1 hypothetical protein Pla8534_19110 [Lignipirellula cremea]